MRLLTLYSKTISLFTLVLVCLAIAQHRGDDLAFQGFNEPALSGVKALAMGGAYTAMENDLSSLFYNPAGLASLEKLTFTIAANSYDKQWQESQRYKPNRFFLTMPFYLEGLYVPDPANNGEWDYILAEDSSYTVDQPQMSKDPYSEDAADWIEKTNDFALNNFAVAYPLNVAGQKLVVAAAYARSYDVIDFDRNDTYLSPHIGYSGYDGFIEPVNGQDTINMDWYRFLRQRSGDTQSMMGGLAYQFNEDLELGLGFEYLTGESKDIQFLDKVGYFGLFDENEFFFSYDTLNTRVRGTSEYSALKLNFGFLYKFNSFTLGVNIRAPYTLTRDWTYETRVTDTLGTTTTTSSGKDEFELPWIYRFGATFEPTDFFLFSLDYEYAPYSQATFKMARAGQYSEWVDQHTFRVGALLMPADFLELMVGYRSEPQTFVPDGSALDDKGPLAESYSLGAGIKLGTFGRVDAAWQLTTLRYYDQYFSNTNYALEKLNRFMFGYTYQL